MDNIGKYIIGNSGDVHEHMENFRQKVAENQERAYPIVEGLCYLVAQFPKFRMKRPKNIGMFWRGYTGPIIETPEENSSEGWREEETTDEEPVRSTESIN